MLPFYFGTNFKMHQTPAVSAAFLHDLHQLTTDLDSTQLFLIPPFTSLPGLQAKGRIWIGAQNMHFADEGEYTGEISPAMLDALGLDLVLLGHAERRRHFGETDEHLNCKVKAALAHGLRVLLCVGETATDKYYHVERETVARQLKIALHDVTPADIDRLLVAYEPVWSIGTDGQPATVPAVTHTLEQIHATLGELFPSAIIPVIYGGSVNMDNCAEYATLPLLDGLFVGRAARTVDGFVQVLRRALGARA